MKRKLLILFSVLGLLISGKSIGQISFTQSNTASTGPYSDRGITTGYFNNDAHLDIAYCTSTDSVVIQLGIGDGTFGPRNRIYVIPAGKGGALWGIDAADLDSDGSVDLFFSADHTLTSSPFTHTGNISILYGNGDGTFGSLTHHNISYTGLIFGSIVNLYAHAADMDYDGDLDIVYPYYIMYNNGAPTKRTYTTTSVPDLLGSEFEIEDLNGDNYPDVVFVNGIDIRVSMGSSGGTFTTTRYPVAAPFSAEEMNTILWGVELIDINGDNDLDVVASNWDSPATATGYYHIWTMYGNGSGAFSTPKNYFLDDGGSSFTLESGDFNQDGLNDIVVDYGGGVGFYTLTGKCDGDFGTPVYDATAANLFLTTGDFNEDGSDDFAGGGRATVFLSDNTDGVSIQITDPLPALVCPGSTLNIPFCIAGTFNGGNVFTAQLSNSSGSFASGTTNIGTLSSTTSGTIEATIPAATPSTDYRIRVVASDPAYNSPDNGSDIEIRSVIAPPPIATAFLDFDGSNDRMTIGDNAVYTTTGTGSNLYFTIEAWIKASSTITTPVTIYSKRTATNNGFWFGLDADGFLDSKAPVNYNGTLDDQPDLELAKGSALIRDDQWHHVAVVRSGTSATNGRRIEYYLDGELVKTHTYSTLNPNVVFNIAATDIWIGQDHTGTVDPFEGSMKDLRYWTRNLDFSEITTLWKTNINEFTDPELVGYWDMNDPSGQTQTDRSATGNDGTLGANGSANTDDPTINTTDPVPYTINAILLDGDAQCEIPHVSGYNLGTGNFTIEGWIKADNLFTDQTIFSKRTSSGTDGIWVGVAGGVNNYLAVEINGTRITSSSPHIGDLTWRHIAIKRSGSTITLYVDGVSYGTGINSGNINTSHDIWIGNDEQSSYGLTGLIDEIRFWDFARTDDEIFAERRIWNPNCFGTAPIGFWRFNATSGQTEDDLGSLNHDNGYLGISTSVELEDPLRTADPAFSGARKGIVGKDLFAANQSQSIAIRAYPNPFTGTTSITVDNLASGEANFSIFNTTGVEVLTGTVTEGEKISIGQELEAGIYILKITDQGITQTGKLIKY